MRRPKQLTLACTAGWGGRRKGAGRRPVPGRRRPVVHRARAEHKRAHPVHLTLRARAGLPSLRGTRAFSAVREGLRAASSVYFRVIHFSVQADHLHLIVEAEDTKALTRGARGLSIRAARAINRALGRRGAVWGDRYHTRALKTPREVRSGLVYVLMNFRKHRPWDRRRMDPCSSVTWFDGLAGRAAASGQPPPVCRARTWLGAVGWKRYGVIQVWERPAGPG
jgi:REP element-mobilizing transposase RayT